MAYRVLVGCEFSGIVREAFTRLGWDAWSCDLLPTEIPGNHIQGDIMSVMGDNWDLGIFHPPCTYLAVSGNRWFATDPHRYTKMAEAVAFVRQIYDSPIPKIAIENPVGRLSGQWRKPDQYIEPWQHGHGEVKKTGLWLKNLPQLMPDNIVPGRVNRVHKESKDTRESWNLRWMRRSRTLPGIAEAMALQWGLYGV